MFFMSVTLKKKTKLLLKFLGKNAVVYFRITAQEESMTVRKGQGNTLEFLLDASLRNTEES